MANKYHNIQQLIAFWEEFENLNHSSNWEQFGEWLMRNSREKKKEVSVTGKQDLEGAQTPSVSNGSLFINLIARLARLQEFYTKKLFEGISLNNMLEFNFLSTINKNPSFKKKEVIHYHMVEYTTGIDIIKRLIKLDLVSEHPDMSDKRSKQLKITTTGKKTMMEALITIKKIEALFFGPLRKEEFVNSLHTLDLLEKYHSSIYMKTYASSGYDILQQVSSSENESSERM